MSKLALGPSGGSGGGSKLALNTSKRWWGGGGQSWPFAQVGVRQNWPSTQAGGGGDKTGPLHKWRWAGGGQVKTSPFFRSGSSGVCQH